MDEYDITEDDLDGVPKILQQKIRRLEQKKDDVYAQNKKMKAHIKRLKAEQQAENTKPQYTTTSTQTPSAFWPDNQTTPP